MNQFTLVAATMLQIECSEFGMVQYEPGQTMDLNFHEGEASPTLTIYVDSKKTITDKDTLEESEVDVIVPVEVALSPSLAETVFTHAVILGEELDEECVLEEVSIPVLIAEEGILHSDLTQYISLDEKVKKVIRNGKEVRINVPVNRRKKKLTAKQRMARSKAAKKTARNPNAKRARAKSMKIRKQRHLDSVGYLLNKQSMMTESLLDTLNMAHKTISEAVDSSDVNLRLVPESYQIRVRVESAEQRKLVEEAIATFTGCTLDLVEELNDKLFTLTFSESDESRPPLVKSFYEKDEDDDDDDDDDEGDKDTKKKKKDKDDE